MFNIYKALSNSAWISVRAKQFLVLIALLLSFLLQATAYAVESNKEIPSPVTFLSVQLGIIGNGAVESYRFPLSFTGSGGTHTLTSGSLNGLKNGAIMVKSKDSGLSKVCQEVLQNISEASQGTLTNYQPDTTGVNAQLTIGDVVFDMIILAPDPEIGVNVWRLTGAAQNCRKVALYTWHP